MIWLPAFLPAFLAINRRSRHQNDDFDYFIEDKYNREAKIVTDHGKTIAYLHAPKFRR